MTEIRYNLNEQGDRVQEIGINPDYKIPITDEPFGIDDSHKWQLVCGEWIRVIEPEE